MPQGSASSVMVRLGQVHTRLLPRRLLAGLDAHDAARVGIDLTEQAQLDLAGEEAILLTREGSVLGLLHVALREVADEIAGDADVEQELPGAALLIEGERLTRAEEIER